MFEICSRELRTRKRGCFTKLGWGGANSEKSSSLYPGVKSLLTKVQSPHSVNRKESWVQLVEVTKITKDFSHKNCLQKKKSDPPPPAGRGKDNKIVLYNLVGITMNDDVIISHNDVYLQYNP